MKRQIKSEDKKELGNYFLKPSAVEFFSSGCTGLNLVLGGGWAVGRISNVVGDKSTAKTGHAIEAFANHKKKYPKGERHYIEAESAFDKPYAEKLGMPNDVNYPNDTKDKKKKINTVEALFEYLFDLTAKRTKEPTLVVVDSLDALDTSRDTLEKIDEGGFSGSRKAAAMSDMFRKLTAKIEASNIHLMIISQVRSKIGVTFGDKNARSGGRALDFYASQVIYLSELRKRKETKRAVEKVTGIDVRCKCKKNKVGLPYREFEYPIIFGYGIHDVLASMNWLYEVKMEKEFKVLNDTYERLVVEETAKKKEKEEKGIEYKGKRNAQLFDDAVEIVIEDVKNDKDLKRQLDETVKRLWQEIESEFLPKSSKY